MARNFEPGEKVLIFLDGFGELESIYDADTQEFVCENGSRVTREMLETGPMNGIVEDE